MRFRIGTRSSVFMDCTFDASEGLRIGNDSVIGARCRIDSRGGIDIGNNVAIASDVIILTADHDIDSETFMGRQMRVSVEDYAWIGTRAIILPGVVISRGAVVGAGSVVTKNVGPFEFVAGMPARLIRERRQQEFSYSTGYKRLFQ